MLGMLVNMDDMAGPKLTHSTILFVDESGNPMHFYMTPCQEKSVLKPLIQHGGGILSSKLNSDSTKLAPDGMLVKSDDYISQKFVLDCVRDNMLLDKEHYRVASGCVVASPLSSDVDMEPSSIIIQTSHNKTGRKKYLLCDDMAIIKYLLEENQYSNTQGNLVWRDMQMMEVTQHSWQSMKDHYKKKIRPNINSYQLQKHEVAKLTGNVIQRGRRETSFLNWATSQVTDKVSTAVAEDGIPTYKDLDEFDQELFANALNKSGPPEGSTGVAALSEESTVRRKCESSNGDSDVPKNKKQKHASTQNTDTCTLVLHRTLDNVFDIDAGGDRVHRTRRKRPLKFRTINNGDRQNDENGASEKNVTSTTGDMRSCDVIASSPLRGDSTHLCDMGSPRKQHTRTLRSGNAVVEKVSGNLSPRPSPEKKLKEKRITRLENGNNSEDRGEMSKTLRVKESDRDMDLASRDVMESTRSRRQTRAVSRQVKVTQSEPEKDSDDNELDPRHYLGLRRVLASPSPACQKKKGREKPRSTTDTEENSHDSEVVKSGNSGNRDKNLETAMLHRHTRAALRQGKVTQSENEIETDDNEQCADPRSYLTSRRGPSQATSPEGIASVISYIMQSSNESGSETEQTISSRNSDGGVQSQQKQKKMKKKQNKDDTSNNDTINVILDSVSRWLGISIEDFVDTVQYCGGSFDDAVNFILTRRKQSGGSTDQTP